MKIAVLLLILIAGIVLVSGCVGQNKINDSLEEIAPKFNVSELPREMKNGDKFVDLLDGVKVWGYDFNHPYVSCVFNKTCNGTFWLSVNTHPNENVTDILTNLSKYGTASLVFCFDTHCSIDFRTHDIYLVNNFINTSFIKELRLSRIESDYKFDIPEDKLHGCNKDGDCISTTSGCCGCSSGGQATSINKEYVNGWDSYQRQSCGGIACLAVISNHLSCLSEPRCLNNTCTSVPIKVQACDSWFVTCKNTPSDQWKNYERAGVLCSDVIELCQ